MSEYNGVVDFYKEMQKQTRAVVDSIMQGTVIEL